MLLVDVANVVGSRPDGWWRDRAGAASRLLASLEHLRGTSVPAPDGAGDIRVTAVVAVLEGAARAAGGPAGVDVVVAPRDGDAQIVETAERLRDDGVVPLVVTADRGLRGRLPAGTDIAGPTWLNRLLDGYPPSR